ncbi:MAG: CRISPR-associated endonuclease Cas3'', partial [Sulfobacillus sp.]
MANFSGDPPHFSIPDDLAIGKTDKAGQYLSLAAHCLDVALVFRALCDLPGIQRMLHATAQQRLTTGQWARLAFLAGLHDLGKVHRGFQQKLRHPTDPSFIGISHVPELQILYSDYHLDPATQAVLQSYLLRILPADFATWFADTDTGRSYQMATFSHHGWPLLFDGSHSLPCQQLAQWWSPEGPTNPFRAIHTIVNWLSRAIPDITVASTPSLPVSPAFVHRFAGLVTLADWLGSNVAWFPLQGDVSFADRVAADYAKIPPLLK